MNVPDGQLKTHVYLYLNWFAGHGSELTTHTLFDKTVPEPHDKQELGPEQLWQFEEQDEQILSLSFG